MSDQPIIQVENLTKAYRIWENPSARIKSPILEKVAGVFPSQSATRRALTQRAQSGYRDFYALQNLSFSIRRGEATGIIGRNGSGKSTLLQLIAGTLTPSAGRVSVNGRVSALLELGSGFNPDFTGRENVYLNGSIYGLTRGHMRERFDEIADFADIGDFIDQPVKTYSSGMMMRLAFAVAISVQPDILIVDEALSVGDVFFTQKCFQRIREILHRGATLIFVSHDMGSVQNLCERGLLLHQGSVVWDGTPEECVSRYFNLHQPVRRTEAQVTGNIPAVDEKTRAWLLEHNILDTAKTRHGDRSFEFLAAVVVDAHGHSTWDYEMMQRACIRVLLRANRNLPLPSVGLQLHDRMGNLVFAAGTPQVRFPLPSLEAGREVMLDFYLTLSIHPGSYTLSLDGAEYDEDDPNVGTFHDRVGGLGPLAVTHAGQGAMPFYGVAQLPLEIAFT